MSTQPLLQRTAAKRIALPVRVEPKVSFANERTFLSWLHFTVVLGGLAVGLLNFGDKVRPPPRPRIPAHCHPCRRLEKSALLCFRLWVCHCGCLAATGLLMDTRVAMAIMIYALYTYHWRAASIRRGGRGPYDDRLGPVRTPLSPTSTFNLDGLHRHCYVLRCSVRPSSEPISQY